MYDVSPDLKEEGVVGQGQALDHLDFRHEEIISRERERARVRASP